MTEFVEAKLEGTTRAAEVQRRADGYQQRTPGLDKDLRPIVHAVAGAEQAITALRKLHADSPEGRRLRQERIAKAMTELDALAPADAGAELEAIENRTLELVPSGLGTGYVRRTVDDELRRHGSARQSAIWSWFAALPPGKHQEQYLAAIDAGDEETVDAIETMPKSMSPVDDLMRVAARERKLRRLSPELRANLDRARARLTALEGVATAARRALNELRGPERR